MESEAPDKGQLQRHMNKRSKGGTARNVSVVFVC